MINSRSSKQGTEEIMISTVSEGLDGETVAETFVSSTTTDEQDGFIVISVITAVRYIVSQSTWPTTFMLIFPNLSLIASM